MYNVGDLLSASEFTPAAERKAAGCAREPSLSVVHTYDDGATVKLRVIDNPAKLSPSEWGDVAACIVQGSTWQFKG